MNEFLFIFILLLPVAWYFGYRHGKKREHVNSVVRRKALPESYFSGLNYLLNEESDKAIDTFVSMLQLDSETVETHLALGNFFRKKGEVNRAIRFHQNLIARPSLSSEHRKSALLELGHDYMSAGLLDRAENIFIELSADKTHHISCLVQLLIIYKQTKDWSKAIAIAEKLQKPSNKAIKHEISHFYCELAEEAMEKQSYRDALTFVNKAFEVEHCCVRATLINAEIHFIHQRYKQAISAYFDIVKRDVAFLPEAIPTLKNCYIQLGDKKGLLNFLESAIKEGAGISSILAYAEILQRESGDQAASEFIAGQMNRHPSIKGLLKLIELHLKHANDGAKSSLQLLHDIVTKLLKDKPIYHCEECGFDAKTLFWQCPGCQSWGAVKPIRGIEGE